MTTPPPDRTPRAARVTLQPIASPAGWPSRPGVPLRCAAGIMAAGTAARTGWEVRAYTAAGQEIPQMLETMSATLDALVEWHDFWDLRARFDPECALVWLNPPGTTP